MWKTKDEKENNKIKQPNPFRTTISGFELSALVLI